jgi:hypothetical protein
MLGSDDASSAADLNGLIESVQTLRLVPVDFAAILQLLLAAGAPLLAVVLTQIPLGSLIKWILDSVV